MKLTPVFLLVCSLSSASAADKPSPTASSALPQKVQKAGVALPQGCIITATWTNGAAPILTVAGKLEPANVPPQKVIFEIGSISKAFTGLLLAQAVLEKKVTLDTTLREMMGPRQTFADDRVPAISLRQLATHTSGLPAIPNDLMDSGNPQDPYAAYDRARLNACVAHMKLDRAPPFPFSYSNLGAGLLGDILSRLYGRDWEALVVDRIAKPLSMTDTCVTLTKEQEIRLAPPYAGAVSVKRWRFQSLAGAGALYSTTTDMLRFGQALDHPELTPLKDAIQMVQQPHGESRSGLGLMLYLQKGQTEYWSQGGTGGYRSWISVNPATHEVVSILINNAALDAETVLFGEPAAPPATPPDSALAAYAGAYDTGVKSGDTSILYTFEVRGSDLWMEITGQSFIPLTPHPTKKDRFEFKPVKAEIQFTRKKDDIVSTTLFQSGLEIQARKLPSKK
jgi:serine-type D-Ala-D-Ala carboxypeptidase/endopeptidase